ncbi:YbdD/YjiX family protein [Williamsia sterculiae]|uniref:Uncharacterized short protein YbdD, DUF466 family n=1 Tax=Williamsia sterculiae TaxID=1344003 RepID=A0A1N7DG95_9NOCA|nr:YbdD/YjiX family protein [Williamsia sterculiae]SIR74810.1 Uncharacterized short protein YbdD, DUF466 family [Williamsia sterculiae]
MTRATAGGALRRGWAAVRWYVGSVMGDGDYGHYVAHQAAAHPGEPPMSERQYWRTRWDHQDRNPQGRCC